MLPSTEDLEITPQQVYHLQGSPEAPSFTLVDCREEDEYAICRIEGSELVPLSRFGELAISRLLPTDETPPQPVIVYCHHGMRSLHATMFLRERGLDQVWSMSGGIDLWSGEIDSSVPRY